MGVKRRNYTGEFKAEAIELAKQNGVAKAASDLGINPANIGRWRKEGQAQISQASPDLEKENRRLRKEVFYLKKINEVLKKSTAIFSQELIRNSD